ncbi:uncharacterized protein MONOS_13414 [Monocercomonoides exilis]|uniref:uncharacterized protein n=1 Tax=Monocercomonoides exilis TaxID=2049356 RepID=UPI00355AAEE7|nr:hypothetical protein MONOS_13414 [Monocercomonoides exilis]|eukprot:MONOS_13414.1-p1 / transcript=MONOS_13414.1 / gene=MONOS_13414 / organism=Monocercomonoides_exilis_PA203 / gene_product=unspecified product / transcript_product=unspecified product / location=Mono_scaffold00824:13890-15334(+) / protein_length=440 / sequence_SO=supercontig / SO=protein_coding / is_pseudo=false
MKESCDNELHCRKKGMPLKEKFSKLFCELGHCREDEKKQKMEEMKRMINEMNGKEFQTVFTKECFNKMSKMIEEKKITLGNAIMLLKHVGYCKELKNILLYSFDDSSLGKRMREMIIDENEKKKDEKLLTDLCECYALLCDKCIPDELLLIIVPCLLKVASKKEGNEETQKEVEIALLALSNFIQIDFIERELYLKEITEIIEHQQKHRNLTKIAYQSAWRFFIYRYFNDYSLVDTIMHELHFGREVRRELEDLSKCVDWKRKEGGGKEAKEVILINGWLNDISYCFPSFRLYNEELAGLIGSLVDIFRASRYNYPYTNRLCLSSLRRAVEKRNMEINTFEKKGVTDLFLEEMKQLTLDDVITWNGLYFFLNISKRLKEKEDGEMDETKRKELKRKIFEKMEADGYEDVIAGFHKVFDFLNRKYYYKLSLDFSDYFVNI